LLLTYNDNARMVESVDTLDLKFSIRI